MSVILVPPPPRVSFVDERGNITRPWLMYLQDLFSRVGGSVAPSTDELEAGIEQAAFIAQTAKTVASEAFSQARRDIRAGNGISVENDAQGVVVSAIAEQIVIGLIPFLPKQQQIPDVRPGSGVSVVRDAQGYVVTSLAGGAVDDMNNIIANKVYGG